MAPVLHSSFIVKKSAKSQKGGVDKLLKGIREGGFESNSERWIRSPILGGRSRRQKLRGRKSQDTWGGTMYHRPTESDEGRS